MDLTKPDSDKMTGQASRSRRHTWTRIMFDVRYCGEEYGPRQATTTSDPLSVRRADADALVAEKLRWAVLLQREHPKTEGRGADQDFLPPEGAPVNPYATVIPKTSTHPNAAKLL